MEEEGGAVADEGASGDAKGDQVMSDKSGTAEEKTEDDKLPKEAEDGDGPSGVDKDVTKDVDSNQSEEPMETCEDEVESEKKVGDRTDKTGLTPEKIDLAACKTPAKKTDEGGVSEEREGKSMPAMTMRFVDETVNTSKDDTSLNESRDDKEDEKGSKESNVGEGGEKPTIGLKLASFSTMAQKSPGADGEEGGSQSRPSRDCCAQCKVKIGSVIKAIVWETMMFCNESCLERYQACMSTCASCNKEVVAASLGKYCVRFGSDIKQFCSNICLEDYKKGLKVCSYCQKDISGGEGFLAPIGDKGQFKDFCDGGCLKKYEHIYLGKTPDPETLPCNVCKEVRKVEREVVRSNDEMVKLCGDACFNAFKFVSSVDTQACHLCQKHFDLSMEAPTIHYEGSCQAFCSKPCQNVFVMQKRKIVPCTYCKVKKYNFDMIEKFPGGSSSTSNLYCSLTCLESHATHQAKFPGVFPSSLPVISAVSSLATPPLLPTQQQIPMQTQTVREVMRETHVLPAEIPVMKNKCVQSKPFMQTKGVSCRPHPCHKETQTEGLTNPTPIPIPVPIHVPTPCKMYNAPFPVPVPIPLPFPVPVFIPTTRRSEKGIQKIIKKILNKIPADPFEAELLALAGDVAGGEGDSSSESEVGDDDWEDVRMEQARPAAVPTQDLENEMSGERVLPKPLPSSTPDPLDRQRAMGVYNQMNNKRRQSDPDNPDDPDAWRSGAGWTGQGGNQPNQRGRRSNRGRPRGSMSQSPNV